MSHTVGTSGDYATIADALADPDVVAGDTIVLLDGYSDEVAEITVEGLTIFGGVDSTGIVLTLGTGIMDLFLTGGAPISLAGNAADNEISVDGFGSLNTNGPGL